jgi:ribulose-phosphate 3-epimerase
VFVPFVSWPYDPTGEPLAIKEETDKFTLEVDLMVADPLPAARAWIAAGADMLVFHLETISLDDFIYFRNSKGVSLSISANNDTALETLKAYAAVADGVQLMGIKDIGVQGQPFDERVIERIKVLKRQFPKLPITVDGSVNTATIKRLSAAGADRFICGSALIGAQDPEAAHAALRASLQ